MSAPNDTSALVTHSTPALIRLSYAGHPDVPDSEGGACYCDPRMITVIQRVRIEHNLADGTKSPGLCTGISLYGGITLFVKESPEEVARLREKSVTFDAAPDIKRVK